MKEINSLTKELKPLLGWHQARIILLAQFILALIKARSTNLTQVALVFSGDALATSNYKRLQRFLRSFELDFDQLAQVISKLFCPDGKWSLSLDRTNWKFGKLDINFLVLAVVHEGVAIPILWTLLPKKGNSNTDERKAIIDRFINLFGVEKIEILTADREFRGKNWLLYLKHNKIPFCLRIPNNTKVETKHGNQMVPVSRLFGLKLGESMVLNKQRHVWGIAVHISCIMGPKGRVVVITDIDPKLALKRYALRWSIETLFGCLKTRGFDLEATHLNDLERLSKLFFVVTLAFGFCFKMGIWENNKNPIPIKKHGRKEKSIFRLGLDIIKQILVNPEASPYEFRTILDVLSCT